MSKIIIKYGGSNLKEPDGIKKLHEIISTHEKPVVVVVSALFGVTDFLETLTQNILNKKDEIKNAVRFLSEKHFNIVQHNVNSSEYQKKIKGILDNKIKELENLLLGIYYIKEVPCFLKDMVLSFGERLSSLVISQVLQSNGIDCEEALPENIGLITDCEHGNASVEISASQYKVKKSLSAEKTFIVPGFYGISTEGKVTLLGRGGTDYAAACIANCIDSPALEIWKDVKGFLSADPRYIKNPTRLERITYKEAAELAYFGAKILHPRTVEPLIDKNIPIKLFSTTSSTINLEPLTVINAREEVSENVVKSISFSDDFCVLKLNGPGVGIKPGILAKVTSVLNDAGINISSVITSQISINILLSSKDSETARQLVGQLELPFVMEIQLINDISLVAVVGHGMMEKYGVAAKIFTVLANKSINVLMSSMGASEVVTYLIIKNKHKLQAINEIHNQFFYN